MSFHLHFRSVNIAKHASKITFLVFLKYPTEFRKLFFPPYFLFFLDSLSVIESFKVEVIIAP